MFKYIIILILEDYHERYLSCMLFLTMEKNIKGLDTVIPTTKNSHVFVLSTSSVTIGPDDAQDS